MAASTQTIAAIFAHQPALGSPAARLGEHRVYWPWLMLIWWATWRQAYPRPFALSTTAGAARNCVTDSARNLPGAHDIVGEVS
jgi:hypothetical protein